jgi:transmembrane sensor
VPKRSLARVTLQDRIVVSGLQFNATDQRIAEEAAQWLIDLEDEATPDMAGFAAWLAASPRHVEEFLLASAVWHEGDSLDQARRIDVERLLEEARANVHPLRTRLLNAGFAKGSRSAGPAGRIGLFAAAVAILAVCVTLWLGFAARGTQYVTGIGEQRSLRLADGSTVTLNTRSKMRVRFSDRERQIELLDGEALFSVAHDSQRPFRVIVEHAVVQAIGTEFNVRRSTAGATVAVVEGVVQIAPLPQLVSARMDANVATPERFAAGQQASVSDQGEILSQESIDPSRVVAWRERRLIFRDAPLMTVADEFNRYNEVQLIVTGEATRARRVTGVFDADDPRGLLAFLGHDPQIAIERSGDRVSIRGP